MLIIPAFAEITAITDKEEYVKSETVLITGGVDKIIEGHTLSFIVINPDNNIVSMDQIPIEEDKTFTKNIHSTTSWILGNYIIKLQYGIDKLDSIEITFELLPNNIQIQTDKSQYNLNDNIFINGTITKIDLSDTTITYNVYHSDDTLLERGDGGILQDDGTFNFTIDTYSWLSDVGYSDYMKLTVDIQNSTASTFFNYYNTPDMTNEVLYSYIMDNKDTISTHDYMMGEYDTVLSAQNNTITLQNEIINSLREDLIILIALVEELIGQIPPLPLDAPIIISVIADDPDNLDDIFSTDDTITILFDSETNTPLGNGMLTKPEVNELFTFSEKIAQAYSGTWTNSSAFTISINSIANSELIINQTTVTPAQITLILPVDNDSEQFSHETSPALIGDWGMP